ncbi:MAG: dihydrodipicolinate synthase family protein, partial [Rickettsiales bacterium]|nr:dihydrodipicolinate synthase family protein [Rickettsiales bacterium]
MNKIFSGTYTAIITPMNKSFSVDYNGFRELIDFQMNAKIDGLVVLGTTGETPTLTEREKRKLLDIAIERVNGKVPVIAGTGSNCTKTTIEYTKRAKAVSADAALVVTPYYNKPNPSGLQMHYKAVANVGLPVILYNVAGRTGRNMTADEVQLLAKIHGVIGIKEASGNAEQIADVIE